MKQQIILLLIILLIGYQSKAQQSSSESTSICAGEKISLTAEQEGDYEWSTGATTGSILVSPLETTTYSVSISGTDGCLYVATMNVTVHTPTAVSIDQQADGCAYPVVLTATEGYSYTWQSEEGRFSQPDASSTHIIEALKAGTYTASLRASMNVYEDL